MPGVHAISGWSTLHASRRSRSLSHSSYTSANPPRPTRRRTSYLEPSARARRWAVGTPASPAAGTAAAARSFVMTVGDGVPQDGQNAEPEGIAARHEGQVSWVVTAPKICVRGARCKLSSAYARAAHGGGRGARIRVDRAARLAAPGAARVSRPTRPGAGSAPTGDRERRAHRAGERRRDEARRVVSRTEGGGRPPPPRTTLARPALVLRQRREHRRDLADPARLSAARNRATGGRLSRLWRERGASERGRALRGGRGRVRSARGSGRRGRPPHPRVRPLARYRGGELHRGPAPRRGSHPRVTVHERRRDGASPVPLPAAARPAAIARQPRARQAGALSRPAAPRHRRPARPDGDGYGGGGPRRPPRLKRAGSPRRAPPQPPRWA